MSGYLGFGITAKKVAPDLSNLGAVLDHIVGLGCTTAELPIAEFNIIAGGRLRRPPLDNLKRICRERPLRYTVHGPLGVNLFVEPERLGRHTDVLRGAMDAAAEIGAVRFVVHAGYTSPDHIPTIADCYARQRECLFAAGERVAGTDMIVCLENIFPGFDGDQCTASPSRIAAEIAAIGHPNVAATLDFSHARLHATITGGDFLTEAAALAPFARHLHLHDSFGLPDDTWTPTLGEKLAFGTGDLHLPIGWGDTPWDRVWEVCTFPPGVVLNAEPHDRYWSLTPEIAAHLKDMAGMARISAVTSA